MMPTHGGPHRAAEHCEVSHAVHSSVVSVFSPMRSPVMPSCLVVRGAGAGCHVASAWGVAFGDVFSRVFAVCPCCFADLRGHTLYGIFAGVWKLNWNP